MVTRVVVNFELIFCTFSMADEEFLDARDWEKEVEDLERALVDEREKVTSLERALEEESETVCRFGESC